MADITEHHTEEEWESDDTKVCWVDFLIPRNAIGVHDFLEWHCELILLEFSRRVDSVIFHFVELSSLELIRFFSS